MTNIVDAPMGTGKTQAAINFINSSSEDKRFIYITPYLPEVDRIKEACKDKHFVEPEKIRKKAPKIVDLKYKISKGMNIVTTHAMFTYFDDYIMDLCAAENYTLILDEVADVVHPLEMNYIDVQTAREKFLTVNEEGLCKWNPEYADYPSYGAKFSDIKRWADLDSLADYGDSTLTLWVFPIKAFRSFNESYILTYMFDAQIQRYYYNLYGMEYKQMYVWGDTLDTYHFSDEPREYKHRYNYKELIRIIDDPKLNDVGNGETALSKRWYKKDIDNKKEHINKLRNNTINFFKHKKVLYKDGEYVNAKTENDLWTTFAIYEKMIGKGGGFSKGFIACNARATNEYKDRTVIAYLVNRYVNLSVWNFFNQKGIKINHDAFALSEMLQFIWRSGIRDGKHITVYVPSKRMRNLFIKWIDENSSETA